jgi:hypothetical protein
VPGVNVPIRSGEFVPIVGIFGAQAGEQKPLVGVRVQRSTMVFSSMRDMSGTFVAANDKSSHPAGVPD